MGLESALGPTIVIGSIANEHGARRNEPITVGLPFPRGWIHDPGLLSLVSAAGDRVPLQIEALERWSDQSVRWALLDFRADAAPRASSTYSLRRQSEPAHIIAGITVTERDDLQVETGGARFIVRRDGTLVAIGTSLSQRIVSEIRVESRAGATLPLRVDSISCERRGPLRTVVLVTGTIGSGDSVLVLMTRYHFYAATAAVRVEVTLRNPKAAVHNGGFWELGDPNSTYLRDVSFIVKLPAGAAACTTACSAERSTGLSAVAMPFEVYQDSSGGENWRSSNHVNHAGDVPVRFRGYHLRAGTTETTGRRATPIVTMSNGALDIAIAHRQFWERFPKAIEATELGLSIGLLPRQFSDLHELQPGEQLTEDFVVSFGNDGISDQVLDWVRTPLRARTTPEWYCAAEAMPYVTPRSTDTHPEYLSLVDAALDGPDTFASKRERIDEYGWRHFGDVYGDHETVFHDKPEPLISHYNNQYDVIAGCACQFFRSGDMRWVVCLEDLARHVIDVDIYHTSQDKSAYNRGLFWHTIHHTDTGRATHRTYPRSGPASGGPAAEHNYNTGLALYYFLTGDVRARETAIDLGQWVVDMDDGRKSPLRWLSRRRTGLATASGSLAYHGPGRGPGNSIVALLNACRLSGDPAYLAKAEELIRRCIHPADDLEARNLLDAERRWYYTIFLQSLGRYLDFKVERGELDEMYAYARAALLHYARWMTAHEHPYLDKPDILEFKTETWAAQDMRKSDVFKYAAKHSDGAEREAFLERSDFFFRYSVSTLGAMTTRTFTRPVVLMMTNGYMQASFDQRPAMRAPEPTASPSWGTPQGFVPQRTLAKRNLVAAAGAGAGLTLAAMLLWLL